MATSNLKAASALDPSFFDNDQMYATQYEKSKAAEQELMDLLDQKKNKGISPSMLAVTGALLDPGRTGSLGEAVGRAATAYANTSQQEHKNAMEDAAMNMQLENMRLGRAQQAQSLKMLGGLKGRQSAEGTTPEGASGPLLNVNGMMVTPDDIVKMKIVAPEIGNALEAGYKLKLESISTQPNYIINKLTGKATPLPGGKAEPVLVPEIGGTLMMGPEDVMAYREAQAKGDGKAVYQIIDRLSKGIGPRPVDEAPTSVATDATTTKPLVKPAPVPPMTQESLKAESEANTAAARKMSEDYAASTTKFVQMADDNRASQDSAADVLSILQRNPKVVGLFDKKGFAPAFWNFLQQTVDARAGDTRTGVSTDIKSADLQKIVMQVDKSFTDKDIADLNAIAGNLARMELGLRRQTYAGSGMGAVSNTEGVPIKETIGSRYENAESLRRKMATIGRGFKLDTDIADAYRKYASKPENKFKTLEDFKRDEGGVYNKLLEEANAWAVQNLKIPARQSSSATTPTAPSASSTRPAANSGTATLNTIQAEAERRRKEREKAKGKQ